MQPLSVSEMRESLRAKTLQTFDGRPRSSKPAPRVASMPCQRPVKAPPVPVRKPLGLRQEEEPVAALKQKLREIEAERSAFFQEGVFDLVEFLCGSENRPVNVNASPWTQHVLDALSDFKGARTVMEDLRRENEELGHALRVVADACAMTPRPTESFRNLAKRLVSKFS